MSDTTAEPGTTTRYFDWEGDACRVHRDANGDLTADLYRAGHGPVETDPTIRYDSREIGEAEYKEMVAQAIALHRRKGEK